MKLAIAVQRYGADINGGAELHARYVAERLARHADVEVVTTCARDYVTWRNERPVGVEQVNGISVRRFPVAHERDANHFGRQSRRVFDQQHSIADELAWLDSEGPASPVFTNSNIRSSTSLLISIPTPAAVDALRRPVNKSSLPHSTLLQSLSFQVQCQRPLYLNRRAGEVVFKAS